MTEDEKLPDDGRLAPDDIGENDWTLHIQQRGALIHELDSRPWVEEW